MNEATIQRLADINRQFYQSFALQFSKTRQRIQPGVHKIIEMIPPDARILDLGCGNGELWRTLVQHGFTGTYIGLDYSPVLLNEARKLPSEFEEAGPAKKPVFIQSDLVSADWDAALTALTADSETDELSIPLRFDFIFLFAVLHHIPGNDLRRDILEKSKSHLKAGGQVVLSVWQFLNSERLQNRIQPWEKAGLTPQEVDPGDYLLDWREGGEGLRYVHHFTQEELADLANQTGYNIQQTYYSDGHEGNLGLYQIWMGE